MAQRTQLESQERRTKAAPIGDERTLAAPIPTADGQPAAELPTVARESYTVWEEVAQGGIGRVLRARDRRLDRPVAIKELLVWDAAQERRFVREALLTARLQHPAIVPIYEAGRWPAGDPFYAMKLLSGRSLADLIAERATLAERLALLPHVLTAAHAVAYAHSQRIIHRDLKPANVLVGEFGETVVIDWGLAKDMASEAAEEAPRSVTASRVGEGLTQQGAVMGTPSYMPPEQAAGAAVDERADVYALGAMLYHVLAARSPYHDAPWDQLLARIAEGPPLRVERLVPQLSDELAAIVHKAMARAPADRYRSAAEMADDLERLQAGRVVAAHTYSARQLLRRYWRRNRTALSIATAALVIVAVVVIAAFVKTDQARLFAQRKEREAVEASRAAEAARHAAEEAGVQATTRADEMTLLQAQDALRRDPNRALEWLTTLSPGFSDAARVRRIAADAQARGISRAFVGHTAYVNRFGVSADGTRFVTASDDKTARVWDIATGQSIALVGHTDEVWSAQFLIGDAEIATASKDSTLRIWDARTGEARATYALPSGTRQLVVRPDGMLLGARTLAGIGWMLRPGAAKVELLSPSAERPRATFVSEDGRRFIVQPEAGEAYVRDVDGDAVRLPGTRGRAGRWFLDRRGTVAVHMTQGTVALWDLANRTRVALDVEAQARPAFDRDGERVALAVDAEVHIYEVRTGKLLRRLVGHEGPVETSMFSADGRRVLTGAVDRTVRTWSLATGRSEVHAGLLEIVSEAQWLADGRSIVAVSTTGEVRLFEPHRAGQIVAEHDAPTTGLALSRDGRVASIDETGRLSITDLAGASIAGHATPRARQIHLWSAPDRRSFAGAPLAWAFQSDGRYPDRKAPPATLLLGTFDRAPPLRVPLPSAALDLVWVGDAVIVGLVDGAVLQVDRSGVVTEVDRFTAAATSVAASTSGAWIAAGSEQGEVRLTELVTGEHRALERHQDRVTSLAFAAGDERLASGCADHTARLWRVADGTYRTYDEGGHGVEQLAFTVDGGALILLSGGETQLRRIDVATGEHIAPLVGPLGKLLGFSLSADGRKILTRGADGAVRVIDTADGEGRTLAGHTQPVTGVGFAAGGRIIVTLGLEGTARAWPDDLPETMAALRAWLAEAVP